MNIKIYVILLVNCLLLVSCSSTSSRQARPQWIDNASGIYLEQDYLTAVGQGSSRERAAKNALANLAEIFVVNVRAETNTLTEASKQHSVLGSTSESSTTLQRNIETETQQVISGVVIKDTWLSTSGEYYALALLNKRKAALSLSEAILEMDGETADLIDYSINHAPNIISELITLTCSKLWCFSFCRSGG